MITITRDDGTTLTISMTEARRVHDAFDREVLRRAIAAEQKVGKCEGLRGCRSCQNAKAGGR